MKPFCSGSTSGLTDVQILHQVQEGELTPHEINPFFFPEPLAPLVAARRHRMTISLDVVIHKINEIGSRCEILLVEGAGGLLVPLGKGYTLVDVMQKTADSVVVVARNQLGTINHTLLTVQALKERFAGKRRSHFTPHSSLLSSIILMNPARPDLSSRSNPQILTELLAPVPLISIPFLGQNPLKKAAIERISKKLKKTLARILL